MLHQNEKETRQIIIDTRLKKAAWNVSDPTKVVEEFEIETRQSPGLLKANAPSQYSDYVLLGRDGKPLAVIEA